MDKGSDWITRVLCGLTVGALLGFIGGSAVEGVETGLVTLSAVGIMSATVALCTGLSDEIWDTMLGLWELVRMSFWDRD